VIHHGAFRHLTLLEHEAALPAELAAVDVPVVLFFGLLRPYKGIETLLEAWRSLSCPPEEAELWIVGRPRMALDPLLERAPPGVRWVPRFVADSELAACFRRSDAVVLPYLETERFDFSGVLATALAFGKPAVITDVGGFPELAEAGAARLVPAGEPEALADALRTLLSDPTARERLARGARAAAAGPYSWSASARQALALYRDLVG
jgi:glycosyltransferase involved in cell wall biosynthesis